MKKPLPKCKFCKTRFTPLNNNSLQRNCLKTAECFADFTAYSKEATRKANDKKWNQEKKVLKEKGLTHSDHIQILQKVFNTFIRFRDKNDPCISCGCDMSNRKGDASHYYPTTYQYLRFNELNVHLACVPCNQHKRGNLHEYLPKLEVKIGVDAVQKLHNDRHKKLELSVLEIQEKIKYYKEKVKQLK